ncbi:MAG: type II secretion system F family protein [Actinomycetes bacterium]
MNPVTATLCLTMTFLGLFAMTAVGLTRWAGNGRPAANLTRRLSGHRNTRDDAPAQSAATRSLALITARTVGLADRVVTSRRVGDRLSDSLACADIKVQPGQWLVLHATCTAAVATGMCLLFGLSAINAVVGLTVGFTLPHGVLRIRKSRRRRRFYAALPDTLQLVAGSLSVGHSLTQALASVAEQSSGPMADELNRALVEMRLGTDLSTALESIAGRMDSTDMMWVVMAIRIQRDVGGNLAEVLTTVAGTLRERERIRRQVQALSAEGRLSALILGALPILLALYLVVLRPEYIVLLVNNGLGLMLLVVGSVMFVVGMAWMRAVVRIEV